MQYQCPLLCLVGLLLSSVPASAVDVDGQYRLTPDAECGQDAEGSALRIEDGVFYGVESQCRMTNPVSVRDMDATLYDMDCTGEGSEWVERALVMRGAEGELILVWNGYAFAYNRCSAPVAQDVANTPTAEVATPAEETAKSN